MKLKYLAIAVLGLVLAFTGYAFAEERVIVADAPTTHHISLYMGIEMGIFKKHGLEVEYVKQATAPDSYKAVAEGRADILLACPTATILEIAKGSPIKIISQIKSPCTSIVTVPAGSPIKTIKDLGGKKIAGISPTCEAVIAFRDATYRAAGVEFNFTRLNPAEMMLALERGEFDGCIFEEPYASEMELKGYQLKFREVVQVPCRFASANVEFLKRNPQAVKKFVAALKEINELFEDNPISDEIVEIAHKYTRASKEAIRHGNIRIHLITDLNLPRIDALQASLVRIGAIKVPLKDEVLFATETKGITWKR